MKGKVFLDKTEIALEAFEGELLTGKAADPEIARKLNAGDAIQYGVLAKIMASKERSGITKLSVLTISK